MMSRGARFLKLSILNSQPGAASLAHQVPRAMRTAATLILSAGILLGLNLGHAVAGDQERHQNVGMQVNLSFPMPLNVSTLRASTGVYDGWAQLTWREVGAYGNAGIASTYTIRVSTLAQISTDTEFDAAQPLSVFSTVTAPAPGAPRSDANLWVTGLNVDVTYYFAIRANNADGRWNSWYRTPERNINIDNYAYLPNRPPQAPLGFDVKAWPGGIRLSWKPLGDSDLAAYRIYRSTQQPPSQELYMTTTTPLAYDSDVTVGTTYYYSISAIDRSGLESQISSWAPAIPMSAMRGLAVSETSIMWLWSDVDGEDGYRIYSPTSAAALSVFVANANSWYETGLSVNTRYARTLQAYDSRGEMPSAMAAYRYTLARVPSGFAVKEVTENTVTLEWSASGNPDGTVYSIRRSLDGSSFEDAVSSVTVASATIRGLSGNTLYYWKVRAENGEGITTEFATAVSTKTLAYVDKVKPRKVYGLSAQPLDNSGGIRLSWTHVLYDVNGATEALAGYNIYRSTSGLTDDFVKRNASVVTPNYFIDSVSTEAVNYYKVRAVDQSSNESDDSAVVDATSFMITIIAPNEHAFVQLPVDYLLAVKNKQRQDLDVTISNKTDEEKGVVYRSEQFAVINSETGEIVKDFLLPEPSAEIILKYSVASGRVANGVAAKGAAASVSPEAVTAAQAGENLALYWHDGVKWIKLGGDIDAAEQTVKIKAAHLGSFQVRGVARPESFRMDASGQSHKIFTPNGDGWNDQVLFRYENPKNDLVTGKVYDLTGAYVADMKQGTETDSLMWDGKDGRGEVVRAGIYVFQIEAAGNIFNGTVVVAK
ncbi:MAG: fibronectin type III domain-containing protein [Elusimicrobia bacterium]|nr:fibronectin type III domain-containing protein [Elusimicrobiota bacterium]